MCEFCEKIYAIDEKPPYDDYIFKTENGFSIFVETGDSFCPGIMNGIEFCPYCGRKLSEVE